MAQVEHSQEIIFPNGAGFTPCSQDYSDATFEIELIRDRYNGSVNTEEYSSDDYNAANALIDKLANMQATGHLGKSERF